MSNETFTLYYPYTKPTPPSDITVNLRYHVTVSNSYVGDDTTLLCQLKEAAECEYSVLKKMVLVVRKTPSSEF